MNICIQYILYIQLLILDFNIFGLETFILLLLSLVFLIYFLVSVFFLVCMFCCVHFFSNLPYLSSFIFII